MRVAARDEGAGFQLPCKAASTGLLTQWMWGGKKEEPGTTPRYFWPEQLGERWYQLLRWKGQVRNRWGVEKKHLKFEVDMLNLRYRVDLFPSGNVSRQWDT